MPKATMSHRDKKDGQSHDEWTKRKKVANASNELKKLEQKYWRRYSLHERIGTTKMTDKNWSEAQRLGIV